MANGTAVTVKSSVVTLELSAQELDVVVAALAEIYNRTEAFGDAVTEKFNGLLDGVLNAIREVYADYDVEQTTEYSVDFDHDSEAFKVTDYRIADQDEE